jgi:hypothetical protein
MLRKPNRTIRNITDFEKVHGWKVEHALGLLGANLGEMLPLSQTTPAHQKEQLMKVAQIYKNYFEAHPSKTHIFPLTGTIFAYDFATGVRDALKHRIKIKAMTTTGKQGHEVSQTNSARKLIIGKNGFVLHDYVAWGSTRKSLSKATGIKSNKIVTNDLSRFDKGKSKVPINGNVKEITAKDLYQKETDPKLKLRISKTSKLSTKERQLIRRAMYDAGFAAAKEILQAK